MIILPPRWHKVVRDLWDSKGRTLLVVLSIAIGVFAFGGLFVSQRIGLTDMADQFYEINPSHITIGIAGFKDDLVEWAKRQQHVADAQGRTVYSLTLLNAEKPYSITLYGAEDYTQLRINRVTPEQGEWPPGRGDALLERTTAARANLKIGDMLILRKDNGKVYTLKVAGIVHDLDVMPATLRPVLAAYVSLDTLELLDLSRDYNRLEIVLDNSVTGGIPTDNSIAAQTARSQAISAQADQLDKELRRRNVAVTSVSVRRSGQHWSADIVSGLSVILIGMGFFSLILSGFLVVNIVSSLLAQQKRQIGMMKVVGGTASQVTGIYLVMVAAFGVLALLIAIPGALWLAYILLNYVAVRYLNFNLRAFYLPPEVLALEIAVGLIVPLLAALVPIINGTSLTAAQAISEVVVRGRASLFDLVLARLRGLPSPTLLAVRNTFRHKARLALTLSTLTLAGTLFISIVNVRSSLFLEVRNSQKMSDFDVQLILNGLYPKDGVERRAAQVLGVVEAQGWAVTQAQRFRPNRERGASFTVYGIPADSIFTIPTLKEGRWLKSGDRYDVVVTSDLLRDEPDLKVGGTIRLEIAGKQRDWNIVGVILSPQSAAYARYPAVADAQGASDMTSTVLIRTAQRTGPFQLAVARSLESRLDALQIKVVRTATQDEILSGINANFTILITILFGMAILIALVGGLGLTGMMSLNVLERTREIGVMRAVGASDWAVRAGVLFEGITVGAISWLLALIPAAPASDFFDGILGQAIFRRPLPYTYVLPGPLIWLAIILVISTVASLLPAERASRISVREALAYE